MSPELKKTLSRRRFLQMAAGATAGARLSTLGAGALLTNPLFKPAQQDTAVTLWGWPTQITRSFDAEGVDMMDQRVLEEAGVTLERNLIDQPDLGPRLRAALPAGTGPDLVATDFDVMGPYWQFMTPLNSYAEAEWGPDWKSLFTPTAVAEMDLVSQMMGRPDEVFYLPGNMQLLGWPYYWLSDFEEHGIDPSAMTSFDDFIAACQTLKGAGLVPMIGSNHPAELADWFKLLVEVAAPGKMADVQQGIGQFTDPDMVETFNLISMMYNEYLQPGALGTEAGAAFELYFAHQGSMIFTFTGTPWFGFLSNENAEVRENIRNNWGTFQLPGTKGLAATDAGIAMIDASQNKDAAWEVLKWITVGQGAVYNGEDTGSPFGFAAIETGTTGTPFDQNIAAPLMDALQNGENVFRRILCPDVYSAITTTLPGVITGQLSAEDAAAEVQEAFDRNCGQWVTS